MSVNEKKINDLIQDRDGNQCVLCGKWVCPGQKYHHVIFRSQGGKSEISNGVALCIRCHGLAHGPEAKGIRERLKRYLEGLYG